MKFCLFLFWIIMAVGPMGSAASPPSQQTVELFTNTALNKNAEEIIGHGSISCRYAVFYSPSLQARGQSVEEASNRLGLLCIKQECARLTSKIMQAYEKLKDISDSDYSDFLQGAGYSSDQIATILRNRNSANRLAELSKKTCETSPTGRMMTMDMCFAVAMNCQ